MVLFRLIMAVLAGGRFRCDFFDVRCSEHIQTGFRAPIWVRNRMHRWCWQAIFIDFLKMVRRVRPNVATLTATGRHLANDTNWLNCVCVLTPMYWPSTNNCGTWISIECMRSLISCWYSLLMNMSRSSNLISSVRRICFTLAHFAYVSRTIPILVEYSTTLPASFSL